MVDPALETIERDVMEYDVVIIGAGPAGLACAIRLRQLKPDLNVCVLEKAATVGAHALSGAVIEPGPLDELLPAWREGYRGIRVPADRDEFAFLARFINRPMLQKPKDVIVHGDATPTNFIFTAGGDVVAIDLERMKNADAVLDIGMVCGELKHAFLWRTGNPYEAEPFIRHFFKSYASHFPNPKKAFMEITMRNPFYMALTELRIARNDYLGWDYRKMLANEAMECLKWGLKVR